MGSYCKYIYITLIIIFITFSDGFAQTTDTVPKAKTDTLKKLQKLAQKFKLSGYGIMNYYGYDWQTDPDRRNAVDIERLVFYPSVVFSTKIRIDAEIEIEHLGTGVTMEFDRLEEFGEFETEVEKGGEVIIERLNLCLTPHRAFNVRIGRVLIPYGLVSKRHRPRTYFTTTRSEVEMNLCPTNWYENGIEIFGALDPKKKWNYHLLFIEGLDATGFSSAQWVVRGHQKRFEVQNTENWAVMARLDYEWKTGCAVGASFYRGNSADNRPKKDLDVPAIVSVYDVHAFYEGYGIKARALALLGTLSNSEAVSKANRNLSNNLNVKRTPVGAAALGAFIEVGYDLFRFIKKKTGTELDIFARYDYYDSMFRTQGSVFDNPRWERQAYTFGLNYHLIYQITFKIQYSMRRLAIPKDNQENTFSCGLGFEF